MKLSMQALRRMLKQNKNNLRAAVETMVKGQIMNEMETAAKVLRSLRITIAMPQISPNVNETFANLDPPQNS